jgi:hypothetical protein
MKHQHCHCLHYNLKYCPHCDVVYCVNCNKEWISNTTSYTIYSGHYTTSGTYDMTPQPAKVSCKHA